jgi:hypothetical protein
MAFSMAAQSLSSLVKLIRPLPASAALSEVRTLVPKIMVDLQTVCQPAVAELEHYMLYLQYAASQNPYDTASVRVVVSKFSSVAAGLMGGRKRFGLLHKEAETLRLRAEKDEKKFLSAAPSAVWQRRGPPMSPQVQFSHASLAPPTTNGGYPQPSNLPDLRAISNLGRAKCGANPAYRGACYACVVLDLPPDLTHSVRTCPNLAAASAAASRVAK